METQGNEDLASSTNRIIANEPTFSKSNTDPKIHAMDESDSDSERETEQAHNKLEPTEDIEINDNEESGASPSVDIHDGNKENPSQPVGHSTEASQDKERIDDCKMRPKIHQFAALQLKDSDERRHVQIISRAGKKNGKYDSWYILSKI